MEHMIPRTADFVTAILQKILLDYSYFFTAQNFNVRFVKAYEILIHEAANNGLAH